jgi:hypothetical protein
MAGASPPSRPSWRRATRSGSVVSLAPGAQEEGPGEARAEVLGLEAAGGQGSGVAHRVRVRIVAGGEQAIGEEIRPGLGHGPEVQSEVGGDVRAGDRLEPLAQHQRATVRRHERQGAVRRGKVLQNAQRLSIDVEPRALRPAGEVGRRRRRKPPVEIGAPGRAGRGAQGRAGGERPGGEEAASVHGRGRGGLS